MTTYNCKICFDAGVVYPRKEDGQPDYSQVIDCECMKIQREKEMQVRFSKYCELPEASESMSLDNFKAYNPKLKLWLQGARDLVDGKVNLLYLASDVDRGKTHLLIAICRAFMAKGVSAKYAFVPLLLDELRAGFQNKDDHSYDSRFNFFQKVGLLGLDDLGAEVRTAWAIEKLETIIDYRCINRLPTVITTNCGFDEFTDRIRSRIKRWPDNLIMAIQPNEVKEYADYKKTIIVKK
jgi:DNA replication protein DnaC